MLNVASVGRNLFQIAGTPARLLERSRGRKRLALLALYLLIGTILGGFAWREASLNGLPDVGDPFDVAGFQAKSADDAYRIYQKAFERLKPLPRNLGIGAPNTATRVSLGMGRPPDRPEYRRWTRENAEALQLWRRATEIPDVSWPLAWEWHEKVAIKDRLEEFSWLAAEQAHLAETKGDPLEAWMWRRAVLRSYRHFTRRGGWIIRDWASHATHTVAGQLPANKAQISEQILRRMLVDLKEIDAMTPPNSETIKAEYLYGLEELSQMTPRSPAASEYSDFRWFEYNPVYRRARKFLLHEPERSRRLLNLVAANQLAYADRPPLDRPPIVSPGMFDTSSDPSAPGSARILDPPTAAAWAETSMALGTSIIGPVCLGYCVANSDSDRHAVEDLLLEVARELYRRDHGGAEAPNAATLVGPYLDKLPEVSKVVGETMP